jgi:hypothetical protein
MRPRRGRCRTSEKTGILSMNDLALYAHRSAGHSVIGEAPGSKRSAKEAKASGNGAHFSA